ncbi:hypothetical protein [Massilia sp. HP4]|uniref:hypothetical protein n=1 Tax=Massilia sp. HP4 TaxID=2562316 RepID=UPI0010BFC61F|nr:hypothetical protein [Massilia sp. HP4]
MTKTPTGTIKWANIGSSSTSPVEQTVRRIVELDVFYLVIGFEVNSADAFKHEIHDLAIDYGHAFYYVVKNLKIVQSFSFGPHGLGKIGWLDKGRSTGKQIYTVGAIKKDGVKNSRPGTADYEITEKVKSFKIPITGKQADALIQNTNKARAEIYSGKLTYSAIVNDTCAETAKEILDDSNIDTPSGFGWIKHSSISEIPIAYAVNPYKWHRAFKASYDEVTFRPGDPPTWRPIVGEADPIYGTLSSAKSESIT